MKEKLTYDIIQFYYYKNFLEIMKILKKNILYFIYTVELTYILIVRFISGL